MAGEQAPLTYRNTGVDIAAADRLVDAIARLARRTHGGGVRSEIGLFAGLFAPPAMRKPILVASTDGVGTKLKVAFLLDRHDTVGVDLVNHCVNDIFTTGATPLFFLDYIATGHLVPERVEQVIHGIAAACQEVGCALLGGETAEMPGFYQGEDYDLAGFIVGIVEEEEVIDGHQIAAGDLVVGLPSAGLHTNGYSLARRVLQIDGEPAEARRRLDQYSPELGQTLGEELLEPHRCYYPLLKGHLAAVKAMAHITGGGLMGNLPRVFPPGLGVQLWPHRWHVPPIFSIIQRAGQITDEEMYRAFNMGIGFVVLCSPRDSEELVSKLPGATIIGKVESGERKVKLG